MTTTHTEIMPATRNLHDQISPTRFGQAPDLFDQPTSFDPGTHVFHDAARTGDAGIAALIPHTHCLACGLFLAARFARPQVHRPASRCPCPGWREWEKPGAPHRRLFCRALCQRWSAPERLLGPDVRVPAAGFSP